MWASPRNRGKKLTPVIFEIGFAPAASNNVGAISSPLSKAFDSDPACTLPGHRIRHGTFEPGSYKILCHEGVRPRCHR